MDDAVAEGVRAAADIVSAYYDGVYDKEANVRGAGADSRALAPTSRALPRWPSSSTDAPPSGTWRRPRTPSRAQRMPRLPEVRAAGARGAGRTGANDASSPPGPRAATGPDCSVVRIQDPERRRYDVPTTILPHFRQTPHRYGCVSVRANHLVRCPPRTAPCAPPQPSHGRPQVEDDPVLRYMPYFGDENADNVVHVVKDTCVQ